MAFMRSTNPSREVFKISGGVCAGKVSLKCADEYSLHATGNKLQAIARVAAMVLDTHQEGTISGSLRLKC